ncbi:MAG: InlB B-repeat-containing protein [Candidatus Bipolaricaulota bacterium]
MNYYRYNGVISLGLALVLILSVVFVGLPASGDGSRKVNLQVRPRNPTEGDPVSLVLFGRWPNSCVPKSHQLLRLGSLINVNLSASEGECLQRETEWEREISLKKLSAGSYTVNISFDGETVVQTTFEVREEAPEPPRPANVTFVVEDETGSPLEGATVQMNGFHKRTDWEGVAVFEGPFEREDFDYRVEKDSFASESSWLTVSPGEQVTERVNLREQEEAPRCTLEVLAMRGGSTEPEPDSYTYQCGEMVEVMGFPVDGWEFDLWEMGGSATECEPTENPCRFELNEDSFLAAHFDKEDEDQPPAAREVNIEIVPDDAEPGEPATINVYGTWENGCVPRYRTHFRSPGHVIRIKTINESQACSTALTDFSFDVHIEELPSAFYVDVYYRSEPRDTFALVASEWFSEYND